MSHQAKGTNVQVCMGSLDRSLHILLKFFLGSELDLLLNKKSPNWTNPIENQYHTPCPPPQQQQQQQRDKKVQ